MKAVITLAPHAPFVEETVKHPIISGARFNTATQVLGSLEDELTQMLGSVGPKDLWIDLKCRQMRISRGYFFDAPKKTDEVEVDGTKYILDPSNPKVRGSVVTPPWTLIEIDHKIKLDTSQPRRCYFSDGLDSAYVVKVDGNKLMMLDGPQKVVGTGESVNILHPSLEIEGFLTDLDKEYIKTAVKLSIHNYMLSYVEQESDITDLLALDPAARIIAKIESGKGLDFVDKDYKKYKGKVGLMAARGDLFVEVGRPHKILKAVRKIVEADPDAIAASRIFTGLRNSPYPTCPDISDIGFLMEIGYKNFMIGDDICFNEDALSSAINVLDAIATEYKPRAKIPAPKTL